MHGAQSHSRRKHLPTRGGRLSPAGTAVTTAIPLGGTGAGGASWNRAEVTGFSEVAVPKEAKAHWHPELLSHTLASSQSLPS